MRRTQAVTALLGLVMGFLVLLAPVASGQTGYPPGACAVLTGVQDVGSVAIGQRFIVQLAPTCVFAAGAPVTVTVNGIDIPGKVANASGFVLVDVTVISATQLSIDDPVLTPARCGTGANSVVARGPSTVAGGAIVSQTATFSINCAAAVPATPATPVSGGRLALTGANMLRWAGIALALAVTGSLLVVTTRRRASARA